MKLRTIYLILALFGTIIPMSYFISYISEHGFDIYQVFNAAFDNNMSAGLTWDLIITYFALIGLILSEGMRIGLQRKWIYILLGLFVGVSLALPAFLYAREVRLEQIRQNNV